MIGLQKYDLEFKLVHMIKGHSFYQLVVEVVDAKEDDLSRLGQEIEM